MYKEENVMADLDQENEVGSVFSYNYDDNMSYYSNNESLGGDYSNKYGENYKSNRSSRFQQKSKSPYELIGNDHYRTIVMSKSRQIPIEFYMTKYYPGLSIRDAVTGNYEKTKVGKSDEDLYFKVKVSVGQDTPGSLFYNSPEEFERHWHTEVSVEIKQKWLDKYTEAYDLKTASNTTQSTNYGIDSYLNNSNTKSWCGERTWANVVANV